MLSGENRTERMSMVCVCAGRRQEVCVCMCVLRADRQSRLNVSMVERGRVCVCVCGSIRWPVLLKKFPNSQCGVVLHNESPASLNLEKVPVFSVGGDTQVSLILRRIQ